MAERKPPKVEAVQAGMTIEEQLSVLQGAVDQIRALRGEPTAGQLGAHVEYELPDVWKRKLFLALCRSYGLAPYRERGMPCSTVRLRVPSRSFEERTLWPEYLALATKLHAHLDEATDRVIREDVAEVTADAAAETAVRDPFHAELRDSSESAEPKASSAPRGRAGYAATRKERRARARS